MILCFKKRKKNVQKQCRAQKCHLVSAKKSNLTVTTVKIYAIASETYFTVYCSDLFTS